MLVQGKASIITHITFFFSFQNSPHRILDDLLGCVGGMFKTVMIASSNTSFKPSCNLFFLSITWYLVTAILISGADKCYDIIAAEYFDGKIL